MLGFLPAGLPRQGGEVLLASIPGALLQFFFVLVVAGLNIGLGGDGTLALVYLPVVCLLPLVVGTLSTLVYERIKGVRSAALRGSVLTAALSGLAGSLLGALIIIITGFARFKPLGSALADPVMSVGVALLMVAVSTFLAILGSAIAVGVLNKMER